ncbi:hypothetical protein OXX69_006997 [Metschnikowia pulcherrima]
MICITFFPLGILSIVSSAVAAADLMNPPFSIANSQEEIRLSWDVHKQREYGEIQAHFEWFFDHLRGFTSESSFESSLFKSKIGVYKLKLSEILSQARDMDFEDTPVARQISFCTHTFFEMAHAAHMIELHDSLATEASILLANMVDLHIRLFALHDSYGNLNPYLMRPLESIDDLQQELNSWRDDFSRLPYVPSETQFLFTDRVKKAQRTMDFLLEQALRNLQST